MATAAISPPHGITPDRIVDTDIHAVPGGAEDAQAAWRALGSGGKGLIWTPKQGGHWIATNGAVVEEIYRANEIFSNIVPSVPADRIALKLLPLQNDGAEHRAFRSIIEPAFRPVAVQGYSIKARQLAIDLIEGFKPDGHCDFVSDFALVMPLTVFLWIVDLPIEDRPVLQRCVDDITRGTPEEIHQGFVTIVAYLEECLADRRRNPGDDLLTAVIRGQVDGRPLTHEEVLGMSLLLLFAGLDTVAAMMSFVMNHLAGNPAARRWIIDNPNQISTATEELMRRHGVANNVRTATQDYAIDGITIRKGEHVLLPNCVHGRDEAIFAHPGDIDFGRRLNSTATFGFGPHRCAGANLARMEMRILLQEWLARIPDFGVAPGASVVQQTAAVNGMHHLPLIWDVA